VLEEAEKTDTVLGGKSLKKKHFGALALWGKGRTKNIRKGGTKKRRKKNAQRVTQLLVSGPKGQYCIGKRTKLFYHQLRVDSITLPNFL